MAAGGRKYFVNAYINIRVLRDTHKCTLPIELFYAGHDEMPAAAVTYMQNTFANLRLIDVYSVADMPALDRPNLSGFSIKAVAILLSSFEEVLFLDADSFPIANPKEAFYFPQYKATGALFWPSMCNCYTIRPRAYDVLGMSRPSTYMVLQDHEYVRWTESCDANEPQEFETGQMVLHKARAWRGLMMTSYLSWWYRDLVLPHLMHGDPAVFQLAFEATNTPYEVVNKPMYFHGIATAQTTDGKQFFCGNGFSQVHPITGRPFFIHRSLTKFMAWPAEDYLSHNPIPRTWTHIARQADNKKAWIAAERKKANVPVGVWHPGGNNAQKYCWYPEDNHAEISEAPENV